MIRSIKLLTSYLLVASLSAKEPVPASKEDSSEIRLAIAQAAKLTVYEGLPHQMFERDLLVAESKRKDTEMIGSFRFYNPSIAVNNPKTLQRILASSDTIQIFQGEKLCGGFHPDYAVQWADEAGISFNAQICFGCQEIIYSVGKNQYRYEISEDAIGQLRNELVTYANKRPKKEG